MQTRLPQPFAKTADGQRAEEILRSCVHCGLCTATCPTYQILAEECDGPRGRIYLIKQFLEGEETTEKTRHHLDRCLSCRSCETTCPSGVQYGALLDIARTQMAEQMPRPLWQRALRHVLRKTLAERRLFAPLLRSGQLLRPLVPKRWRGKIPARQHPGPLPETRHARRMIGLAGCAQAAATPATNASVARVLDRLGISLIACDVSGCCGAVDYHLEAQEAALARMRYNIDQWWPLIEDGAEAIVISASACTAMVKEYAHLLAHDPNYADKAARISAMTRDIAEVLRDEDDLSALTPQTENIAFHCPCTLQHGQKLPTAVQSVFQRLGVTLPDIEEAHLCCGSAGTYSILQPQLSQQLLDNKLAALMRSQPAVIATANIGCQLHLSSRASVPVRHWIECIDPASPDPI